MADLSILGTPMEKQKAATAKREAAKKALADRRKKAADAAAAAQAEEEKRNKRPSLVIPQAQLNWPDDALIRAYGKDAPAAADKQRKALAKKSASTPAAAKPAETPPVSATKPPPPTVADVSAVGKLPWQQLTTPPQFVYPANYTVGDAVYMGINQRMRGMRPGTPESVGAEYATKSQASETFYTMDEGNRRELNRLAGILGISQSQAWNVAVDASAAWLSNQEKITPLDALRKFTEQGLRSGAIRRPSAPVTSTTTTTTAQTPATSAVAIADQALSQYLGRAATAKERAAWIQQLTQAEKASPVVTKRTGIGTGNEKVTQTGGVDASQLAADWAKSQQGAGEYAAATKYLNTFLQSLANPVNVAGV